MPKKPQTLEATIAENAAAAQQQEFGDHSYLDGAAQLPADEPDAPDEISHEDASAFVAWRKATIDLAQAQKDRADAEAAFSVTEQRVSAAQRIESEAHLNLRRAWGAI